MRQCATAGACTPNFGYRPLVPIPHRHETAMRNARRRRANAAAHPMVLAAEEQLHESVHSASHLWRSLAQLAGSDVDGDDADSDQQRTGAAGVTPELDAAWFVMSRVADGHPAPMAEVDAVVYAMALAMRRDNALALPLFTLRKLDEYPATHACNVSMPAIGLSEALGLSDGDARAIGAPAFRHNVGNAKLPKRLFTKTGDLTKAAAMPASGSVADAA